MLHILSDMLLYRLRHPLRTVHNLAWESDSEEGGWGSKSITIIGVGLQFQHTNHHLSALLRMYLMQGLRSAMGANAS